ncbi:MAG: hypothetical protein ABID45_04635, partial [Patescibacteria group bacterium]
AQTGNNVEFREFSTLLYQIPIWGIFAIFMFIFLFTLRFIKKPHHVFHILFKRPSDSFNIVVPKTKKGTYQYSYDLFKNNAFVNKAAAVGLGLSLVALIVIIQLSPDIRAADDNGVAVEPGNYLRYTISYNNEGDGDASNVKIADAIPSCTNLISTDASGNSVSENGKALEYTVANIENSSTGSVSYVVQVQNPCHDAEILGSAASFVSNEVTEAVSSNVTSNPLESSSLKVKLLNTYNGPIGLAYSEFYLNDQKIGEASSDGNGELSFSGLGSGVYLLKINGPSSYSFAYSTYINISRNVELSENFTIAEQYEGGIEETIPIIIDEERFDIPKEIKVPQTEEERQELKEQLELFLKLLELNGQSVTDIDQFNAILNDIPGIEEYLDEDGNVKTLIRITGPEFVLKGITLPEANITITIKSDPIVRVTKADKYGKWEIRIPMELIPPGEHTIYAKSELYGVETDEMVLGKFTVYEEEKLSKTMWLFIVNLALIVVLTIVLFFYTKKRGISFNKK